MIRSSLILGACLALGGCAAGTDYQPAAVAVAPAWRALLPTPLADEGPWWQGLNDPQLDRLIGLALAQNLDIEQAMARVDQSLAALRGTGAALRPSAVIDGRAARTRQSTERGLGRLAGLAPGFSRTLSQYDLTTMATWEIDLAGGLRRAREAAAHDLRAAEAMAQAARLTVAGETADAYVQLRALQARLSHAQAQADLARQRRALVDQQERAGEASRRQLEQAIAALAEAQAATAPLAAAIDAQLNRLAVLTGRTPQADRLGLDRIAPIPSPRLDGGGTPADVMRRRPDVMAAERRLAAAHTRVGQALAEYYPRLSLSALAGVQSDAASALFTGSSTVLQGAAGLRWRLFDFQRIDAEVAAARGAEREALAAYRQAVLQAAEEVETAYAAYAGARNQQADLQQQHKAAARSLAMAQAAWEAGEISRLDLIVAEEAVHSAATALVLAEAEAARRWIACRRALGG